MHELKQTTAHIMCKPVFEHRRSGDLMTVVSVVCVVDDDDDDDDDGRINFNVAYSPKTARTCNS